MAKKSFVLRIEDDDYKALEKWAADEFRSVNGQIEWLIDFALKESGRKKTKAKKKREKIAKKKKASEFLNLSTEVDRLTNPMLSRDHHIQPEGIL